ncbi:MAG: carboxymuconolactone decarboxylase family protein [Candidatus Hydrogenedentes bacterium]|nr:carboxymuconolactone decarboxylase family protein [Candidatus Hydrogenedentota bacterium]
MHFAPIERPAGIVLRIAYWVAKRRYGKVPTVMKVLYARRPIFLWASLKIANTLPRVKLEPELRLLIGAYASFLNGCMFCRDLAEAEAVKHRIGLDKFKALQAPEQSDAFNARERAALAYVAALLKDKHVPESTFESLRKHFNDVEILDIIWLTAAESYFNALAVPLGIGNDGLRQLAERNSARA